jgi:hypothetical protein
MLYTEYDKLEAYTQQSLNNHSTIAQHLLNVQVVDMLNMLYTEYDKLEAYTQHSLNNHSTIAQHLLYAQVVVMLNMLYTEYDKLEEANRYGIYKVETIGDAYMCATGVPDRGNASLNAISLAKFALKMVEVWYC